ncbi:Cyanophycinase [Arcticibacter svalbardensis MN12-7]|uniref:Cyanophycinase n=1 Tax=Arcticibacter svalbardensis MN12-7 TaxID=1150600 RepID=R9GR81_9SPHI|nr:cyanophycinase [Arcticibacter svalbardensis]EOR94055.1 Cyanophycinase [Arcticibacter svalbardensis MN12-7]
MVPKGKLVIIGGAVDLGSYLSYNEDISHPHYIKFFERGILKRMITESAKGEDSIVEVITTASKIPEIVGKEYIKSFNQLQVNNVGVLDISSREGANTQDTIDRIKKADIVMLTGGDQLRLSAILGGTELHRILKRRYIEDEFMIAGTSAGAAAASTNMIYRGSSSEALLKGEVQITGGLGFIDNVIIDTHFVQRGRIGRLFYAVASNPGMLGVGLGEDAGLLITDGVCMEAIGAGLTILVDGRYINETSIYDVEIGSPVSIDNLKVHVMSIYDKYDLQKHNLIINKAIQIEDDVYLKIKDYD